MQVSHPLSSPCPSAFNCSQHHCILQRASSSHQVAKVSDLQFQHQSVLPVNIQDWFHLGLTGLIFLLSKALSRVFSNTRVQNHKILQWSAFLIVQLSHPYIITGKTWTLTRRTFFSKVMSLVFNRLSRLLIAFLPRSKRLLISWLQSQSGVILEPKEIKSLTVSTVSPSICYETTRLDSKG